MKKLFIWLIFLSTWPVSLAAQNNPQTINSTASTSCAKFDVTGLSTLGIQVTGTWTATLQPEVAIAGQSAVNTQVTPSTSSTAQSTITANGAYVANVAGYTTFFLCASAYTSGTASVWFQGSSNVNASFFGSGGGGTVTSVSGTANQIDSTGGATPVLSLDSAITLPGTINKYTLTAPATAATLAIANNKTFTVSNSLTLAGTDSTTQTFPSTSGNVVTSVSSAGGDLSGTYPNPTVANVNGAAVPTSANGLSSNASKQLVASTAHNTSVPLACVAASGSGTAYTCTTSPSFTPADGDAIHFEADVASTGAVTLNVNSTSAATVNKQGGGTALVANDLLAGQDTLLIFDGTNWQMQGQTGNAASGGANTALSNLAAVAVNTAPLPGTTNSIALGSASKYWSNLFSTAIQCGIAGTTSCVFTGAGSTSGTATFTFPAVAGTATNPVVASNAFQVPVGAQATPSYNFTGFATYGMYLNSNIGVTITGNFADVLGTNANEGALVAANRGWGWASTNSGTAFGGSPDTSLWRDSAGVVDFGSGTVGSKTGSFNATNGTMSGAVSGATYLTATNCANGASPAVCGSAASGAVALPTGTNPTLQVNTIAVTANSRIQLTVDESLTIGGTTCNTTLSSLVNPVVTARSAGASFTFTMGSVIATNPVCVSYTIVN